MHYESAMYQDINYNPALDDPNYSETPQCNRCEKILEFIPFTLDFTQTTGAYEWEDDDYCEDCIEIVDPVQGHKREGEDDGK